MKPATLIDYFQQIKNSEEGIRFVQGSQQECFLSYNSLYDKVLMTLGYLQKKGIKRGQELVMQLEDNQTFLVLFWACLLGGIIPVPLAIGRKEDQRLKLFKILQLLDQAYLVISSSLLEKINFYASQNGFQGVIDSDHIVLTDTIDYHQEIGKIVGVKDTDIAYVQFSSGSTGDPKGVKLTHRNLVTNAKAILNGINSPENGDKFFSWMPLTHDMGLIGFHIVPLVAAWSHFIMPTETFIRRPSLWLQKINEHRISFTASPNFGYKYLLSRINKKELEGVDLSCLRIITNGAEPISADLCRAFVEELSEYRLDPKVIFPVYGLAEASLAVTFSEPQSELVTLKLNRDHLKIDEEIEIVGGDQAGITMVGVGKPINDCSVRIYNQRSAKENVVGRVQIKGDNVTEEYYKNEEATKRIITFDGWLDTGDLGFFYKDQLYVVGRAKDVIFINGQNYFPHDIEKILEDQGCVEPGKVVAGGCTNFDNFGNEEVIIFVLFKGMLSGFMPIAETVKAVINSHFGFEVHRVIPVQEIPKTTSGKVQRHKLVLNYLNGDYQKVEKEFSDLCYSNRKVEVIQLPSTTTEKKLFEIWCTVLNNREFGISSSFFELGGNSLKAAEIVKMVADAFSVEVSFGEFFENPTIKALSAIVDSSDTIHLEKLLASSNDEDYPLAPSQSGLYYVWASDKTSTAYNIPFAVKIKTEVDVLKLEESIIKCIRNHNVLRSSFYLKNYYPVQKVDSAIEFSLQVEEVTTECIEYELQKRVLPFDLEVGPLFRIEMLKLSEQEHVLFFDFHHIILDGISIHHLIAEIFSIYNNHEKEITSSLQYKDYVNWQHRNLENKRFERQKEYWLEQFEKGIPTLDLPLDFKRPALFNFNGKKVEFNIGGDLSKSLRKVAVKNGVTLQVLMLSCYYILLSKFANQEDIVVGIPVEGRRNSKLDKLVGMFVNSVPFRYKISPDFRIEQLLSDLKNTFLKAYDHQDYPFTLLTNDLIEKRDLSRNPVFDTMFIFQNFDSIGKEAFADTVERYYFDPLISKYDLSIEVIADNDPIKYYFEFSTSLFKEETIRSLAFQFEKILNMVSENQSTKVSDMVLLDESQYEEIVFSRNSTEKGFSSNQTISGLFEEQVKVTPDSVALSYNGENYTYAEVNKKANQAASSLVKKGVTGNAPVAILLERTPEFIFAVLGILKVGACFVPIDVEYPDERVALILEDCQTNLIISNSKESNSRKLIIKQEFILIEEILSSEDEIEVRKAGSSTDLAYMIYTSGTTGRPKGVMISHKSLINYIEWGISVYFDFSPARMPLFTSVSFDLTITTIFAPLLSGNTIVVYSQDSTQAIEEVVKDNSLNVIKLTPSHLKLFPLLVNESQKPLKSLKKIIVGGEDLESRVAKVVYDLCDGEVEIFNEYGPTEATVGCMIKKFDPYYEEKSVPIGCPINNTQIYILDSHLKPVVDGVAGELYISGFGLAKGYWNNPVLTETKFIPNPFILGTKMYKSGDLVKRNRNGEIAFLGRIDRQTKIRGYRVELNEIEEELLKHPDIKEVIVLIKEGTTGDKKVVAYYTSFSTGLSSGTLTNYLTGRIPTFMIPAHFVSVISFPVSKNFKIDYKALESLPLHSERRENIKPNNPIENLLVEAWKKYLDLEEVSTDDNFFELGGDSIKAVQISSYFNNTGWALKPKDILTYQTIELISLNVTKADKQNHYDQGELEGEKVFYPIDNWFFNQNFTNPHYYHQSVLLRFKNSIDHFKLGKAFEKLVKHHDAFRLNLNHENSNLFFNNELLKEKFLIETYELSTYQDKAIMIDEIGRRVKNSIRIDKGFPIRAVVINESPGVDLLLIVAHHLTIDGVSWRVILEDLYNLYSYENFKLPSKTASINDCAIELNMLATSGREPDDVWKEIEINNFKTPLDFKIKEWKVRDQSKLSFSIPKETTTLLMGKEIHKVYNTDILILLLSALNRVLYQWTKADKLIVELENNGRFFDNLDTSRTVGWFTSLFPLSFQSSPIDNLTDWINETKERIRKVKYGGIFYGAKNFTSDTRENKSRSPIRFNYLGQFNKNIVNNDLFCYSSESTGDDTSPENDMTAEISIDALLLADELILNLTYNSLAHSCSTIEWLVNSYIKSLQILLHHISDQQEIEFTPSDFDEILDSEDLKQLFG